MDYHRHSGVIASCCLLSSGHPRRSWPAVGHCRSDKWCLVVVSGLGWGSCGTGGGVMVHAVSEARHLSLLEAASLIFSASTTVSVSISLLSAGSEFTVLSLWYAAVNSTDLGLL
ncbi:hypothetical protein Tco_0790584 [Tanacetum coccineum]